MNTTTRQHIRAAAERGDPILPATMLALLDALAAAETERDGLRSACVAACHALRSYQHGNSAPGLAKDVADDLEWLL